MTGTIDISDNGLQGGTQARQVGYVFKRRDGLRTVQSRLNGFSYAVQSPYGDWESFHDEAWESWERYKKIVRPARLRRIGVRYINQIIVHSAQIEIKDYLRTAVDVSPYLPQMVMSHFMQVQVPLSQFGALATIVSTIGPTEEENATNLILDIDVWRATNIEVFADGADFAIHNALKSLRAAKNFTFEACITDATRGLIS